MIKRVLSGQSLIREHAVATVDVQQQKNKGMKRFEGQLAVITGGADGLGKGIAYRLASEGCRVVLFDINGKLLQQTVEDLKKLDFDVEGLTVDIASEDDVKRGIDHVDNKFGKIDVMVNSAGIVGPTGIKITEYNTEDFDNIYRINLRGAFLMTKYTVKAMEKNNYGRILLIASIAGKEGNPFMAGYTTMKAGVIGLVKGIGKEFAETGITINGLAPAVIRTAMNEKTAPEQLAFLTAKIPMKRLGTIEEVAAISAWIVSKESTFTTGFVFDISGGRATY
jgi:NAD(P)-dependent dehydrogenase (short-subunit alcohol dehydrogenase family)